MKDSWDSFTPKISLSYAVNENTTTYITASTGFKSGGFNGGDLQGESFDQEDVFNYEAGIKGRFLDGRLNTAASIFYMDYQGLQVTTRVQRGDITPLIVTNAAKATVQGIEIDFQVQATEVIYVDANLAYLDAAYDEYSAVDPVTNESVDASGNSLNGAPEWAGNFGIEYRWTPFESLSATLRAEYLYKGDTYFAPFGDMYPSTVQDSYSLYNLNAVIRSNKGGWSLAMFVKNITDENSASYKDVGPQVVGNLLLPPKLFGLTVGYYF